jgi:hypothetical protein
MLRMRQALMLIEARIGAALAALADLAEAMPKHRRPRGPMGRSPRRRASGHWPQAGDRRSSGSMTGWRRCARASCASRFRARRGRPRCWGGPGRLARGAGRGAGIGRSGRKLARQPRPDRGVGRMAGRPDHGLRQDGGGPDAPDPVGDRGDRPARRGRVLHHAAETEPGCAVPAGRPGPFAPAQAAVLQGAAVHAEARDGAAWFAEWLTLPPLTAAAARAISVAGELAAGLEVRTDAMARHLDDPLGLIHAEALSFALAPALGRAEAQASSRRWPPRRAGPVYRCPSLSPARIPSPPFPTSPPPQRWALRRRRRVPSPGPRGPGRPRSRSGARKELTRGIVNPHVSI